MKTKIRQQKTGYKKTIPSTIRFIAIGIIGILFLCSVFGTYTAYQTPLTKKIVSPILHYTNIGRFDYIALLKNNTVYDNKTTLRPGEGTFFKLLIQQVNVTFSYTFQIDHDADIAGNYTIDAILQTNLWTKSYPVVSRTPFNAHGITATFNTQFPLNYTLYEQLLQNINEETGVSVQTQQLILQSTVVVYATTTNHSVSSVFSQSINVSLNQKTLDISKELSLTTPGVLTNSTTINQEDITNQRTIWTALSVIFFAGLPIMMLLTTSRSESENKTEKEIKKIKKKYGEWIIETKTSPEQPKSRIILVKSLEDLSKVSEELGKPILLYGPSSEKDYRFYVLEDSMMYEYEFKTKEKMIKVVALCPKCGTKNIYEDYPGKKINVVCPNCGNPGIVSFDALKTKLRPRLIFSSLKEKQ
ncbi:MAG: hypothetical protein IMZ43_06775 [Thermoplasmata archaeon]|nr:hypothetical protein [Thermoplasmata archaeon]